MSTPMSVYMFDALAWVSESTMNPIFMRLKNNLDVTIKNVKMYVLNILFLSFKWFFILSV